MAQELKAYNVVATIDVNPEVVDSLGCTEFAAYDADEVDAVLAEYDAEIERLNNVLDKERSETIKYMDELCNAKNEIERLTIDKRNNELRADVADATVEKLKAEIRRLNRKYWNDKADEAAKMKRLIYAGRIKVPSQGGGVRRVM